MRFLYVRINSPAWESVSVCCGIKLVWGARCDNCIFCSQNFNFFLVHRFYTINAYLFFNLLTLCIPRLQLSELYLFRRIILHQLRIFAHAPSSSTRLRIRPLNVHINHWRLPLRLNAAKIYGHLSNLIHPWQRRFAWIPTNSFLVGIYFRWANIRWKL